MDATDYKNSKHQLGIKNPDLWCAHFGISKDTDKSYSSGRLPVPQTIENMIADALSGKANVIKKIKDHLTRIFPSPKYDIELDQASNDITVASSEGIKILFENGGKDWMGQHIYRFNTKRQLANLLLFLPKTGPVPGMVYGLSQCDWFLWPTDKSSAAKYRAFAKEKLDRKVFEDLIGSSI